ncbi:Ig-like domain-containing protein [Flavobacterium psychrotrophum]|uniref:Ig-like domain-containing protein n=1 Tax=Flavobacterium psychrotrophum TaxID=2294119 RepID=UPI000E313445|nr:Ig-like domain-containing protein [Flavobacterium psychrotrophum]
MKNNLLLHYVTNKYTGTIKIVCLLLFVMLQVHKAGAQAWENVGSQEAVSAGGASFNNLVMDGNGNYYLSYYDTSVAKGSVQKFNGTTWSYAGGSAGITTGSATFNALATDNQGNVYYSNQLGYPESGMAVRKFNGTTWSLLPQVTNGGVNYQAIGVSQDNVVFAYNNENNGTVKRYVNGAWEQVGNTGFSGGASYAEMAVANNTVYTCNIAGGAAQVYKISTTATSSDSWELVGGTTVGAASSSEQYNTDIAIDGNNNIYVAYASNSADGQKLNVKKFDGTAWVQVGEANFTEGRVQYIALAVTLGGEVYVAASNWEDDNFLKNRVYKFDSTLGSWIILGGDFVSTGQATYNDLIVDNANDYLILTYSEGNAKVKRISITAPPAVCSGAEPGPNTGDTSCITLTYMGEQVNYATVRGADGKVWLQQNLGSTAIAGAITDEAAYGDLYQWGRWADGHQKRDSATSASSTPNNPSGLENNTGQYITGSSTASWWSGNALTDTWTGATPAQASDINGCDPCKALLGQDWKLPSQEDWQALVTAESITNPASAFASSLKLPGNGYRSNTNGDFTYVGARGYYWSSTTSSTGAKYMYIGTTIANPAAGAPRGQGAGVRCIYARPVVAVESVEVAVQGGAQPTITTVGGTLQLVATVAPTTASQLVAWSLVSGDTAVTLSATGTVTALANGTAVVRAKSLQDPTKFDDIEITVALPSTGNGITGYNYDIIANGVGNASVTSQIGLDEVNSRALVSLDFQGTAGSTTPVYGLPVNRIINSASTPGISYQLANYSGSNALYLTPSYVTNSINNQSSGTLSFEAQNKQTVYILSSAAGGGSTNLPFTATVNFSDGSSQQATLQAKDWYDNSGFAIKGIGRVNRTNNNMEGNAENPRLYENSIAIDAANQAKTITGIAFTFSGDASAEYGNEIRFAVLSIATVDAPAAGTVTVSTLNNVPATITTANGTLQLTAAIAPATASQNVTWSVTQGTAFATVNANGLVTATATGTVTVRATSVANTANYGEIQVAVTIPEPGYCEAYFINGCADYVYISGVATTGGTTNINNTSTGCSNDNSLAGYANYTAQSVTAPQGSSVNFNLNFHTASLGTSYLSAWIDWNHDFTFSDDEQVYASSGEEPSTLTFTANVPQNAALGATRIRLKVVNGWIGSGACGYNSFGEIEDYTFNITEALPAPTVVVTTQNNAAAEITTANGTLQLVATVTPATTSQNVTWSIVAGNDIATIDANGLVTATASGTVTVKATSVENTTSYGEFNITVTIAPTNDCQPISYLYENFDSLSCCEMGVVPTCWDSIRLGGASQIISGTQPASGTSQIYQFGYGANTVSIVVLPQFSNVNAGTHQFRFKAKANNTGALDFGYITDINNAATFVIIESLTITNSSYNSADAERTLTVPVTVPANARLALRNPGTTWAGMYWDDVYWEPIPAAITVATQNNVAAAITTNAGTLQLTATVTPVANTVNWTITEGSANATVDANGLVTATANGTVTVRATIAGTELFDEIQITISNQIVAVTAVTVTVSGNAAPAITTQNGTLQLVATVTPANATNTTVTWSIVSGTEVATVDANGLVTATANGTVTVRATSVQDPTKYDDIEVTVTYVIAVESIVVTVENDAAATITTENGTLQLIATAAPTTANQDVTWSIVSGDTLATIDQDGLVTAVANGTVTVRATSVQDPAKYDDIEIVIFIESLGVGDVNQTTFSIYPNPVENNLNIVSNQQVKAVKVYNQIGQLIKTGKTNTVDFTGVAQGVYIVEAEFSNGAKTVQKIIKK